MIIATQEQRLNLAQHGRNLFIRQILAAVAEFEKSDLTEVGIRFLRGYDMVGASGAVGFVSRLDTIFGIKIVRSEWIVRIRD